MATSPFITSVQADKKIQDSYTILNQKITGAVSGFQKAIMIADVPTEDGYYFPVESGTFPNAGGLTYLPTTTDKGYKVTFIKSGAEWFKDRQDISFNESILEDYQKIGDFFKNSLYGKGDNLTGWTGQLTLNGDGNFKIDTGATVNINNTNVSGKEGDKLYVSADLFMQGTQNSGLALTTVLSGSSKDSLMKLNLNTPFNTQITKSNLVQLTSDFDSVRIFKQSPAFDTIVKLKRFAIINLTDVFGKGNEPQKEDLDLLIPMIGGDWFNPIRPINLKEYVKWFQAKHYNFIGISDDSVKIKHLQFLKESTNILDFNNSKKGYDLVLGVETPDASKNTSNFIETYYGESLRATKAFEVKFSFFNKNKSYLSSKIKAAGTSAEIVSPYDAHFLRATFPFDADTTRVNRGLDPQDYEDYGATFKDGFFRNNPDKTHDELVIIGNKVQNLIDEGVGEKLKKPILSTYKYEKFASGSVIESSYAGVTFGRNSSGSQIWYIEKGNLDRQQNLITGTDKKYKSILAISENSVLALSGLDNGLYLVNKPLTGATTETKVLDWEVSNPSFTFSVDCYPKTGGARLILMAEYGDKHPTDFPRHVHLSEDGGLTWRVIFELPNQESNRTHLHGVHYDPYADRIWICNGDGPSQNLWYIDDWRNLTPTYTQVFPSLSEPVQFTSIYSTPEKVLFGTDGGPNGIWCIEKDVDNQKKTVSSSDVVPLYIIDPAIDTNYVGRTFKQYEGFDGIYMFLTDASTTRGSKLVGSYDGNVWHTLIEFDANSFKVANLAIYKNLLIYTYAGNHTSLTIKWL